MIDRILIWSMIRTRRAALAQSGNRFSEKIMLKHNKNPREESMKKFYLSAAAIAASVALPGLPATIAVSNVANEAGIPHIGLAPFPITPDRAKWSVSMPQPIPIMGKVIYEHMKTHNIKTVGYIGYSDSYGDLWFNDFKMQAVPMGMTMIDEERFARPDTSVAGQVL